MCPCMDFTHLGEIMSINDVSAGGADDDKKILIIMVW